MCTYINVYDTIYTVHSKNITQGLVNPEKHCTGIWNDMHAVKGKFMSCSI